MDHEVSNTVFKLDPNRYMEIFWMIPITLVFFQISELKQLQQNLLFNTFLNTSHCSLPYKRKKQHSSP